MDSIHIDTIGDGIVPALFENELEKVVNNIADPNTAPKQKREIDIKVTFSPTESRELAGMSISVKSKLAPVKPHETSVYIITTRTGVTAHEHNPLQTGLDFDNNDAVPDNVHDITREAANR